MKDLVPSDSPILTGVAAEVLPGEDINKLVYYLRKMSGKHRAAGIAAPQIGVAKRVIIFGNIVAVNPRWVNNGTESDAESGVEGCLSFPGQFFNVRRYTNIAVTYLEFTEGRRVPKQVTSVLTGFIARVFQHECDHLDGKLVTRFDSVVFDQTNTRGPVA